MQIQIAEQIAITTDSATLATVLRNALPEDVKSMEAVLLAKSGKYVRLTNKRLAKTLKGCDSIIEKQTTTTLRAGIEYSAQARVNDAYLSDSMQKTGLPESMIKLSSVLCFNLKTRNYLFAFAPTYNNPNKVEQWFSNGKEVSKESLYADLQASEMSVDEMAKANRPCNRAEKSHETFWLFYKAQDIISIS